MRYGNEVIGRREFFRTLLKDIGYLAGSTLRAAVPKRNLIRPPGSIEEPAFLAACQRCGKCREACLEGTIRLAGPDSGLAVGTPYLVPNEYPCTYCMKCIEACPSGALITKENPEPYIIGKAIIDPLRCLAYNQQICNSCRYACPQEIKAIRLKDFQYPIVDNDKSNGCGRSAKICIAPEAAIHVVPH